MKILAIDTETVKVSDEALEIPQLVLVSASSGADHTLLYPHQLGEFLLMHWDWTWVGQNFQFDYWVMVDYLRKEGRDWAAMVLTEAVDNNRVHDTMVLDQLLQLARASEGEVFKRRNLDDIGRQYAGLETPKDDPYRLRYHEILGKRFDEVDPGFLDYAIGDAVTTRAVIEPMLVEATELMMTQTPQSGAATYDIFPHARYAFGPLSEGVQVKASIVLDDISRRGLSIDPSKVGVVEQKLRDKINDSVAWIKQHHPDLFDYYKVKAKVGEFKVNKDTGIPKFQLGRFREILEGIAADHGLKMPRTAKDDVISASVEVWKDHKDKHPLLQHWMDLQDTGKLLQFVVQVRGRTTVHPEYNTLVRTGRTSARKGRRPGGLNIQQMPREGWFRELFVARPGKKLVAIDYSFIELRTLASVCLARYGRSVLADVINRGVDPHAYTASMIEGVSLDEFLTWKKAKPDNFKASRQAAKAINFGVPGGLGAAKLSVYAKANYGVNLSVQQAGEFKQKLITQVYPELETYLSDRSVEDLALNIGAPPGKVRMHLDIQAHNEGLRMASVRKIVAGKPYKQDGTPYNEYFVRQTWNGLEALENTGELRVQEAIARQEGSLWLEQRLFRRTVSTLTGRLRAGVGYTEARNTPFQGLAADGAKLALWELMVRGFDIVAFIHDEILLEMDAEGVEEKAKEAGDIMNQAMERVLFPGVPCAVEWGISDHWAKG